jgi:hypothetical protein
MAEIVGAETLAAMTRRNTGFRSALVVAHQTDPAHHEHDRDNSALNGHWRPPRPSGTGWPQRCS